MLCLPPATMLWSMFQEYKHAHFIGIGGIGMSALAKWFLHEGVRVSGSDIHPSAITKELEARGAQVFSGHALSNLAESVDLAIYSPAIPETNIERVLARERGIPERTNFEFLGDISKSFSTIVVTGTNGKSTTTAMLGLILIAAGYDPTVVVGSFVPGFKDGNLRLGKGRFFVVEGCEYRANMMHLNPEMIILTNIEEDHLDYYQDLQHIQKTFQSFIDKLKGQGMVALNVDDAEIGTLQVSRPVTYGSSRSNPTYSFNERILAMGRQRVRTNVGEFELQIPGEFNVYNAMAAIAAAMELGVSFEVCQRVLKEFRGIWRRFERVGQWQGAEVISDYGHHPSAIRQTIEAAREFFPGRRIVVCYQPHQHDRTKKLFNEFVVTLPLADRLIVTEIYDVAGRDEQHDVSSRDLVEAIKSKHPGKDVQFADSLDMAESQLRDLVQPNDLLLIMGAGDIDELARRFSDHP